MSDLPNPLDAVDEIYTDPAPLVEFVRMQIGFWEKVVVLDAATLAATFTASGAFHGHVSGDGGVGYLVASWKFLFCGLSFCLLAQWLAIPGAIAISGHSYGMRVLSLLKKSAAETTARGGNPDPHNQGLVTEIVIQSPKLRSRANLYSRLAGALGSTGLLSTIAAFYWLFRFAQLNVHTLGH